MDVYVGDRVQIVNGGMDVTNGNRAKSGKYYGEGGPLWATVSLIDYDWPTGRRFGLPPYVTRVRCENNGVLVWQVQPEDIARNVIHMNVPVQSKPVEIPPKLPATDSGKEDLDSTYSDRSALAKKTQSAVSLTAYAIDGGSNSWAGGLPSSSYTSGETPSPMGVITQVGSGSAMGEQEDFVYDDSNVGWRELNDQEKASIGRMDMLIDDSALRGATWRTAFQNPDKRRQLLNEDIENIQNGAGFPKYSKPSSGLDPARYNYQIIIDDPKIKKGQTLENQLQNMRASLGLPVHGSNMLAKAMKYYMYNRFKSPDINLAHSKTTTHVFFTRPDLNLLVCNGVSASGIVDQAAGHTDSAMIWKRHPELFKLLTNGKRCGDPDNFNMLLSQQVANFDIQDETLGVIEAGKSWTEYVMNYGEFYGGRKGGEFSCSFTETSDYSVISLIKLWMTYIDNVARGAWKPSYNLRGTGVSHSFNDSHVYTKTLDYASSAYVFKCGPDGEDVLYWTKYYGVFPISTGASALSWDLGNPIGDAPKLPIRFVYSFKKDLSPISLLEFNHNAHVNYGVTNENSFSVNYAHSSRPYVGTPYIEISMGDPTLVTRGVNYNQAETHIRLKFKQLSDWRLTDSLLYRTHMSERTSRY